MAFVYPQLVVAQPTQFITTSFVPRLLVPIVDIDSGLNDNYLAQQQVCERLHLRILDKWLYEDDMCYILKYLKIKDGKVSVVSSVNDYKGNKICSDSVDDVEKKADYIEENFLTEHDMRKLLTKMVNQLGYKWYDLLEKESLVVEVVEKYLRKRIKSKIPDAN